MIIPIRTIAKRLGWNVRRTRARLHAVGATRKSGRGVVVPWSLLMELAPEIAHAVGPVGVNTATKPVLETADVAKILGCSVRQARRIIQRKQLGEKRGGRFLVSPARVVALVGAVKGGDDDEG